MELEKEIDGAIREAVQKAVEVIGKRLSQPRLINAIRNALRSPGPHVVTTRAVSPGTRGRCILEYLAQAGTSPATQIARKVPAGNTPPSVHLRRVREQLHYLALPTNRYVRAIRPGVWTLTPQGRKIIEAGRSAAHHDAIASGGGGDARLSGVRDRPRTPIDIGRKSYGRIQALERLIRPSTWEP